MKFEIYKDAKGEFRWRLKAANGRIIAESGEGYKRKVNVRKAIDSITGSVFAVIVDKTDKRREGAK